MTPLRDPSEPCHRSPRPAAGLRLAQRGFTLVELVVALAIVGALLVVAFGGLRVAVAAWHRGDERAEAHQHARSITVTVARAVGAAYPYRAARAEGESPVTLFKGDGGRLEFVSQAPLFPAAIPVAFTAVVIELREGAERPGLVVRQRLLPNHRPFADATAVIEDGAVTALRLSYLGEGGWQTEWDAEAQGGLPRAVRIAMDTGKAGAAGDVPALTVAVGATKR
jgi:general secretion pathway protein J